ncbi:MAG: archaeal heat shock protein Hsp20, partial [Candidatus Micrarchaeota archaeon]
MAIKRRRSFGFFGDGDDYDDAFDAMRREMDEMLKNFAQMDFEDFENMPHGGSGGGSGGGSEPKVYGFSFRVGEDGKPVVQEFGNTRHGKGSGKEREPLVDIIKGDCEITVIAELPGASKNEIRVRATEESLEIEAEGAGERRYSKTIALPAKVRKDSAKASFKNGILEVRLALAEPARTKENKPRVCGDEVKID